MPGFKVSDFSFLLLLTFFSFQVLAQAPPNGINYQAVVRDVSGSELTNTSVVFRFTIRTGSTSGTLIYQETQNAVTNSYGLVFLVIGQGTQTIASPGNSLSQLNWLGNSTFVNVEIAIGASPFTSMGSSQYLTTPYSFVSGTAISVSGGNVNAANLDIVNGIRFESMNKNGAVLTVDGTGKVGAGYITGTTYTAGSGISISGSNQIINTGSNINLSGVGTTILGSGTSNPTVVGQKLIAGSNITITGNTISAAAGGSSQWLNNGQSIYYNTSFVGIGTSSPDERLTLPYSGYIGWEYSGSNSAVAHRIGKSSNGAGPLEFRTTFNPGPTGRLFSFIEDFSSNEFLTILYSGNVGIGTNLPVARLDVNGNSILRDSVVIGTAPYSTTPPQVHIYTNPTSSILVEDLRLTGGSCTTGAGPMMTFQNACGGSTNTYYQDWITAAIGSPYGGSYKGDLTFYTNDGASTGYTTGSIGNSNFERMRITSLGNVGIGVPSPAYKLDVNGDLNANSIAGVYRIAGNEVLRMNSNYSIMIGGAGNPSTIGTYNVFNGYVAGYSNTSGNYNVYTGIYAGYANTTAQYNAYYGYAAGYYWGYASGDYNTYLGTYADGNTSGLTKSAAIGYNAIVGCSNCMVLGGTGSNAVKVGIGVTSPTQTLEVNGDVKIGTHLYFNTTSAANSSYAQEFIAVSGSYIVTTDHFIPNLNNTQDLGTSGYRWRNAYLNNNPSVSSDIRLKKDINKLEYGLDAVKKLNPVTYKYKDDKTEEKKIGLIAQETQKVIPEIVQTATDSLKTLSIKYGDLVPVLIKAIQEQQVQIQSLQSEIEFLKKKK